MTISGMSKNLLLWSIEAWLTAHRLKCTESRFVCGDEVWPDEYVASLLYFELVVGTVIAVILGLVFYLRA